MACSLRPFNIEYDSLDGIKTFRIATRTTNSVLTEIHPHNEVSGCFFHRAGGLFGSSHHGKIKQVNFICMLFIAQCLILMMKRIINYIIIVTIILTADDGPVNPN